MLSLQNNNYFLSFHSLIFHSKVNKYPGTFFGRGWSNSLKQTFVEKGEWVTCKMNRDEQGGGALRLVETFFKELLMAPLETMEL